MCNFELHSSEVMLKLWALHNAPANDFTTCYLAFAHYQLAHSLLQAGLASSCPHTSCWEQPLPHHTRANIRTFSVMRCRSQRKHCRSGLCVFTKIMTSKNSFTSICPHFRLSAARSLMLSAVTSCISHLHPLTSSYIKRETALLFRFHWWHAGCRLRAAGCSLAAPGFPLNPPNPVNPS